MKYKPHDIVLIKSRWISDMPAIEVRLLKKAKKTDGGLWHAKLIKREHADLLRKKYNIPFKYPDNLDTMVYEDEIIRKKRS